MNYHEVLSHFIAAAQFLVKKSSDPELDSPEVKIEPMNSFIQKAVQKLKQIDPNYFKGVRQIKVNSGNGFGFVESGPNKDPAVINLNLSRIENEVRSKSTGASPQQIEEAIVQALAETIAHEKGHTKSYDPKFGFQGGEGPSTAEEQRIRNLL